MGIISAVAFAVFATLSAPAEGLSPVSLVRNMELAYEKVEDYRMEVEVRKPREDGSWKVEKFTFSYKKPLHVRMDFAKPRRGTIVVYPGRDGKVLVRPWGRRALDFHLSKESFFLADPSGQRIDQADLGLLIRNIAASFGERQRGPFEISETDHAFAARVLAEDHFLNGRATLYGFVIDKELWLPLEIREFTAEGSAKREILFRNIQINPGIDEDFFRLNGK